MIGISPDFRSGYAEQYNLMVEHEIAPWQTLVKAAYVGNLGRRLGTTIDLNQPTPSPTARSRPNDGRSSPSTRTSPELLMPSPTGSAATKPFNSPSRSG